MRGIFAGGRSALSIALCAALISASGQPIWAAKTVKPPGTLPAAVIPQVKTPVDLPRIAVSAPDAVPASAVGEAARPALEAASQALEQSGAPAAQAKLDRVFDHARKAEGPAPVSAGPVLTVPAVLQRAARLGVSRAELGKALVESDRITQAAVKLTHIPGLASMDELIALIRSGYNLEWFMEQLWFETALDTPSPFSRLDKSWPVPATVVEKDGVIFHLHGVVHGTAGVGEGLRPVRRLVSELKAAARPLYTEENLPQLYGYRYGWETLDHAAKDGIAASLRPAVMRVSDFALGVFNHIVFPLLVLAAVPFAIAFSPKPVPISTQAILWGSAAVYNLQGWAKPMAQLVRMWAFNTRGSLRSDKTHRQFWPWQFKRDWHSFRSHGAKAESRKRSNWPMPLYADTAKHRDDEKKHQHDGSCLGRSWAMAKAAYDDARAKGHKAVHILCGYGHVEQMAWFIAKGFAEKPSEMLEKNLEP